MTRHGFHDATTDTTLITHWLSRWPDANLALATGGAGFDVLDVDLRPGGSGFLMLERLRRACLTEGWAFIVRTPSGGLHFYYPARPEVPQPSWSAGHSHIDFRGTGGYVLVPPSKLGHPGGPRSRYEMIAVGHDSQPVDATAIKSVLRPTAPASVEQAREVRQFRDGGQRILAWVATRPEGSRNTSLFWAACRFADHRVPQARAEGALLRSAQQSGLDDSEAVSTIRSAYRQIHGSGSARGRPGGLCL